MNKSCKVLVLGGSGFIGANVSRWLRNAGFQVVSFDRVIPEQKYDGIEYVAGDFFDDETLDKILCDKDVVLHSLSTLNPGNSNTFFFRGYSLDFVQTVKLFEKASRMGTRVIFFSSAGTVYGRYDGAPFDETHALRPINHYGSLKVLRRLCVHSTSSREGTCCLAELQIHTARVKISEKEWALLMQRCAIPWKGPNWKFGVMGKWFETTSTLRIFAA